MNLVNLHGLEITEVMLTAYDRTAYKDMVVCCSCLGVNSQNNEIC